MINREQMFILVLEAHPDFTTQWKAFENEWANEQCGPQYYTLLSELVRECSRLLANGETCRVVKVLEVVEHWFMEGDEYVREAAAVGFLKDLQNDNLHVGTRPKDFVSLLGPNSSYWWRKVENFWNHGDPIVDDC